MELNKDFKMIFILTCSLPKTLINTPPSNVGCESMDVTALFIFWKANDCISNDKNNKTLLSICAKVDILMNSQFFENILAIFHQFLLNLGVVHLQRS